MSMAGGRQRETARSVNFNTNGGLGDQAHQRDITPQLALVQKKILEITNLLEKRVVSTAKGLESEIEILREENRQLHSQLTAVCSQPNGGAKKPSDQSYIFPPPPGLLVPHPSGEPTNVDWQVPGSLEVSCDTFAPWGKMSVAAHRETSCAKQAYISPDFPTSHSDDGIEAHSSARSLGQSVRGSFHLFRGMRQSSAGSGAPTTMKRQRLLVDSEALKGKVYQSLRVKEYNVFDFYKDHGIAQKVARSMAFETTTLCVIFLNAIWIAIDTDQNKADVLIDAEPLFQIVENLFCIYFVLEWGFRFSSFRWKRSGLSDFWFSFDTILVVLMVLETWLLTIALLVLKAQAQGESSDNNNQSAEILGNASILRLFRLMRLTRMARLAKLLRAIPEITVLLNGMLVATRTVVCTISLLFCIVYVFAVAFVNLGKDTVVGNRYFPNVGDSFHTLLIAGAFPDLEDIMRDVGGESFFHWILLMIFILFSTVTVMNMLIGVLVEVVKVSSQVERDQLDVKFVRTTIMGEIWRNRLAGCDSDDPSKVWLTRPDFELLLQNPVASKAFQGVGIDVVGLIDVMDFIYKEDKPLAFPDLMEVVLQLRSSNGVTVRDIVDLRKYITHEVNILRKIIEKGLKVSHLDGEMEPAPAALRSTAHATLAKRTGSAWESSNNLGVISDLTDA